MTGVWDIIGVVKLQRELNAILRTERRHPESDGTFTDVCRV